MMACLQSSMQPETGSSTACGNTIKDALTPMTTGVRGGMWNLSPLCMYGGQGMRSATLVDREGDCTRRWAQPWTPRLPADAYGARASKRLGTCGEPEPDRAHWMWACPQRCCETRGPSGSASLHEKAWGGQEDSETTLHKAYPAPTASHADCNVVALWPLSPTATDGGAIGKKNEERCGAWGVAVPSAHHEHRSAEGKVVGRDQTAFACDLFAAHVAIAAAALARTPICLLIDNQAEQCGIANAVGRPQDSRKHPKTSRTCVDEGLRTFGRRFRARLLLGTISWQERKVACT